MLAGLKMAELHTEIWQQIPVKPPLLQRKKEESCSHLLRRASDKTINLTLSTPPES